MQLLAGMLGMQVHGMHSWTQLAPTTKRFSLLLRSNGLMKSCSRSDRHINCEADAFGVRVL